MLAEIVETMQGIFQLRWQNGSLIDFKQIMFLLRKAKHTRWVLKKNRDVKSWLLDAK